MRLVFDRKDKGLTLEEETRKQQKTIELYTTHLVARNSKKRYSTVRVYTVWRAGAKSETLSISTAYSQTMIAKDCLVTEKFVE